MEAEQRHSIQFDVFNLRRARRNSLFNIYEEINLNSNNLLEMTKKIVKKENRTVQENNFLQKYFEQIKNIFNVESNINNNFDLLKDNLNIIIPNLKFEKIPKNDFVFRSGELIQKFYIVLKGTVSTYYDNEEVTKLTEEEYVKYLVKLRLNNENEIIEKILKKNLQTFKLDDKDFEKWLRSSTKNFNLPLNLSETLKVNSTPDDTINLTHDKFLNSTVPDLFSENSSKKRNVFIYKYMLEKTFKEGDFFGDITLNTFNKKRQITAITHENSEFATLDRELYHKSLKELIDKDAKSNSQFLVTTKLFNGLEANYFNKFYYPLFIYQKLEKGKILLQEGDGPEYIYLVKKGEFSVTKNISIQDFNHALSYYNKFVEIPDVDDEYKIAMDHGYKKFMKEKKCHKIAKYNKGDIIGMEDMIIWGIHGYTVECTENNSEILKITINALNDLLKISKLMQKNKNEFISFRFDFFFHRLSLLKETSLSVFQYFKEDNYNKTTITIPSKPVRIQKKFNVQEYVDNYMTLHRDELQLISKTKSPKRKTKLQRINLHKSDVENSTINIYKEYEKITTKSPLNKSRPLIVDNLISSYYTKMKKKDIKDNKVIDVLAMDRIFLACNKLVKENNNTKTILLKKVKNPIINRTKKSFHNDSYFNKIYTNLKETRNNSLPQLLITKLNE